MSIIDERIATAAAALESANAELTELETTWNNGSPVNHSCEMRSALWQRIVEVREVVFEAIKNQVLAGWGIPASDWNLYEYDPVTGEVKYNG